MKPARWSVLKSERLKRVRGVSFEEIIKSKLIDIRQHPKKTDQKILVFEHKGYLWAVPCVEDDKEIFLKTIFPSRKLMKICKRR
jgi:hypothetical protein